MPINIGSLNLKEAYVGSTPIKEVWVGSQKVWQAGPRVVTVRTSGNNWVVGSQSGDVSMIQSLSGPKELVFSVPVTCDLSIIAEGSATKTSGSRLEAGWVLSSSFLIQNATFTFTEIL